MDSHRAGLGTDVMGREMLKPTIAHHANETLIVWSKRDRRVTLIVSDRLEYLQVWGVHPDVAMRSGLASRRVLRRLRGWLK